MTGVTLRHWRKTDASDIVANANDERVWNGLADGFPYPYTLRDAEGWLQFCERPGRHWFYAIALDDQAIGGIGIIAGEGPHEQIGQFGYWLGHRHWNRGIGSAAAASLKAAALSTGTGFTRLEAPVFLDNPASMRVLERVGFTRQSGEDRQIIKAGKWRPAAIWFAERRNR